MPQAPTAVPTSQTSPQTPVSQVDPDLPDLPPQGGDEPEDLGMSQVVSPSDANEIGGDPDADIAFHFFENQARERTGQKPIPAAPPQATPPQQGTPQGQPAVVPPQPQAQPQGVVPPVAAPAVQPVQAQPPVATPAQPVLATPQPAQPTAPQAQPQQRAAGDQFRTLHAEIERNRPAVIDALATRQYGLSAEELEQIGTEPDKVIPKLMAKAHVAITQGVLAHLAEQLPVYVGGIVQAQAQQGQLENEFYQQWPQLDRSQHANLVHGLAVAFRQLNPQADAKTMMQMIGAQAVVALGLQNVQPPQPQPQPQPRQRVPAYRPAAPGRASTPPQNPSQINEWTRTAAYIAADEAGLFDTQ